MTRKRSRVVQNRHTPPSTLNAMKSKLWFRLFVVLMILAASYFGYLAHNFWSTHNQVEKLTNVFPSESERPLDKPNRGGTNFLLLGVDTINDEQSELPSLLGNRSDTIMVVHISENGEYVSIISIMRDSWVEIPGHGKNRINAALALGGIPKTVSTIENLLDARIDHVAAVDFTGFKQTVDFIGGVQITNPMSFQSSLPPYQEFKAGLIELDGEQALAYSRERKNLPRGDYQRVENQRAILFGILTKILSKGIISNPKLTADLYSEVAEFIAIDESFKVTDAISFAYGLRSLASDGLRTMTLPVSSSGINEYGMAVVYLDELKLSKISRHLAKDTIHTYIKKP